MFIGEFAHSVEDSGRVAIPSKFREKFAAGLVVTRGLDRCLFAFTAADWGSLADRIAKLPLTQSDARAFARFIFSGATDCQLDSQGRILLPNYLRDYADIRDEAIIIGVNTRLEIWNPAAWQTARAQVEDKSDFIAENLASLGI